MSFGEAMVRFTPPGHDRLGQAEVLELGIAAAELNCCVNISNLSRKLLKPQMKTAYVTKLVDACADIDDEIMELALEEKPIPQEKLRAALRKGPSRTW